MSVSLDKEMKYLSSFFPNLNSAKLLPSNPYLCVGFHWHHWTVQVIVHASRFICRLWARVCVWWVVWFALFIWESFQLWILNFAAQPPEIFPSRSSLQLTAEFLSWKLPEGRLLTVTRVKQDFSFIQCHLNLVPYIKEGKCMNTKN